MMWFQRHEEPKTITDEFEQVRTRRRFHDLHEGERSASCDVFVLFLPVGHVHLL